MSHALKQAASQPRNWYRDAAPDDRREYDAFGPWITEVKTEADMPKRFRYAYPTYQDARFLLKIPRDAERQQMRPGMDLYLAVLAIHEGGVCLMRLENEQIATREIAWGEVAALHTMTNLLVGRWTLLLRDGDELGFDYNTVSARLMEQVDDFVRSHCGWQGLPEHRPQPAAVPVTDHLFEYMLYFLLRSGPQPVTPIHFEPGNRRCRNEANRRRLTTGLMILDAPGELILVNRNEPMRTVFQPNYAVCCIAIPYRQMTGFALASPPAGMPQQFHDLVLRLDRQVIHQPCLLEPDAVIATLEARGVPRMSG
jgi:hypothetical protein